VLILSRKVGQSIRIGENIVVTVLEWKDGQVSLGITAPRHIVIHRSEIFAAIERENRMAATSAALDLTTLPRP
jgi:carbon storage regulator